MKNRLTQHITLNQSISIQWVNDIYIMKISTNKMFVFFQGRPDWKMANRIEPNQSGHGLNILPFPMKQ